MRQFLVTLALFVSTEDVYKRKGYGMGKCKNCGIVFAKTGTQHFYCGNTKSKTGCSYKRLLVKSVKRRKGYYRKEWYKKKQRKYYESKNSKFYRYKRDALTRGLKWDLSFEKFCGFWGRNCFYCGDKVDGVGIDRMDNSKGYLKENCVICCSPCNKFKLSRNKDEFVDHCKKVAKYRG